MIRALIAESVPLIRAGLLTLLTGQLDIEFVAELDREEAIVPTARAARPDVAVIDEKLAGDEFCVVRELREAVPGCGSVILTSSHSPGRLREAVTASADGFVGKEASPEKIADAVRQVASGSKALDPELAFSALNAPASPLTAREIDVLRLAAEGVPDAEIARNLYLAIGTVRNYVSRAVGKTGTRTRADAIRKAQGAGWL